MFDTLSDRLQDTFARLRGHERLSEAQVDAALREVAWPCWRRTSTSKVVKDFIARVRERAVGRRSPAASPRLSRWSRSSTRSWSSPWASATCPPVVAAPPTVVLMAGLQGSGKTTTAAKLARWLAGKGRKPLLVACDLQRPAAVKQLQVLGSEVKVSVRPPPGGPDADPVPVALGARDEAERTGRDVIVVDTAGRLAIDAEMMAQAAAIREAVQPTEVCWWSTP